MFQIIQAHENKIINTPEGGYEAITQPMTREELHAFKENTKGFWHPSAAFLAFISLITLVVIVYEIELPFDVIRMVGTFIIAVIVLTFLEKIAIWKDLRNPTKEIITGLVSSKRLHQNASNRNGSVSYSYFLQFQNGEELSVTSDVYENTNTGDIFRMVRALHSRRTLHEYIQKSTSEVERSSTNQAIQDPVQPIAHQPTTPMPVPLGMGEQAATKKIYRYLLYKRRWKHVPNWMFFGFVFFFMSVIIMFFLLVDEVIVMSDEFIGFCLLMYWVILFWLLHRKINKDLELLRQDILLGYQLRKEIIFVDKIRQNVISRDSVFVPSPKEQRVGQGFVLVASDKKEYLLESRILFNIIQVNVPYTVYYLPQSGHWLCLKSTDSQQSVLFQYK